MDTLTFIIYDFVKPFDDGNMGRSVAAKAKNVIRDLLDIANGKKKPRN